MSIFIQQISYIHADKEILFKNLNISVNKGQKIALIGNNGSGKSTLLQIIAGRLSLSSGTIICPDDLYYIPQHFGQFDGQSICEALQADKKISALHAILHGDASIDNFNILNDDWGIEERIQTALTSWGINNKLPSKLMNELSGGEKTRVLLAGIEIHNPSVILLDEPTNHLDAIGKYIYLNQEYSIIKDEWNILEQAESFNSRNLPEHEVKTILNRYLFPASVWNKPCRKLSGGEKMRLTFCCLMISNNTPDLFILDEPTNNLDIQSIEIITSIIKNYKGTVVIVSHDKYFVKDIGIHSVISYLCSKFTIRTTATANECNNE